MITDLHRLHDIIEGRAPRVRGAGVTFAEFHELCGKLCLTETGIVKAVVTRYQRIDHIAYMLADGILAEYGMRPAMRQNNRVTIELDQEDGQTVSRVVIFHTPENNHRFRGIDAPLVTFTD